MLNISGRTASSAPDRLASPRIGVGPLEVGGEPASNSVGIWTAATTIFIGAIAFSVGPGAAPRLNSDRPLGGRSRPLASGDDALRSARNGAGPRWTRWVVSANPARSNRSRTRRAEACRTSPSTPATQTS